MTRSGPTGNSPWRHLPNAISLLRIVLVVPIGVAIGMGAYRQALGLMVIAGVSDGADGWLARHFGWESRLGSILDPIGDKLLLATCFTVLTAIGWIPWWLLVVVLGRDLVITVGAIAWQRVLGHFTARPSWVSKASTVIQILYVLAVLVHAAGWWRLPLAPWTWWVLAFTVASWLDYVLRWGVAARREWLRQKGDGHES